MAARTRTDLGVVAILAVAALVFLALELFSEHTLVRLTVEDGPIEYLTALVFLVSGILFIAAALFRSAAKLWSLALGLGSIFIAGEEISWGQRLLGIATPESLAESNVQSELNFHNLEGVHGMVRGAGVLILLAVFVVFPILVARWEPARRLADRLRIPRPPLTAIPVLFIGLAFMVVPRILEGGAVFRLDEVGEIYVAIVMLFFAVKVWRTSARTREPVAAR